MVNEKVWTQDFILHFSSYIILVTSFYFLVPTLPVYVVNVLGESKNKVGYIIGFYAISALLVRPFGGLAMDVLGRKTVYLASLTLYILLMLSYTFATSFLILILIRFFQGLSWGVITTGGATIAADMVPQKRRGEGLGYFGLTMTLSMAVGPIIGLYILGDNAFDMLFYASFALASLAMLVALFIPIPNFKNATLTRIRWGNLFEKKAGHLALVMFFSTIPYAGIMTYISLYGDEIGVSNSGIFFIIYAVGVSISRPISGKILDRKGPKNIFIFSYSTTFTGLILLGFSSDQVNFLVSSFIIGLGSGTIMPTLQTMIINMVNPGRRAVANSTFFSAMDIGFAIGSIALGYIAEWISLSYMFIMCGVVLLLPMMYFFIFALKHYNNTINSLILQSDSEQ
jgi:MFS family permease